MITVVSDRASLRPYTAKPWWKVGHRVPQNPFASLGTQWCQWCKGETEVDTDASHRRGTYVFSQRCLRCGRVTNWGVYQAPLLSDRALPAAAVEWVTTPGRDRR